jgi:DNA-binding transcriptional LysR family regulator
LSKIGKNCQAAYTKMMSIDSIDWERQRAFLAVLRTGSLSGAARLLDIAQPTVRRRIAELEAATGAALFTRTPGGLQPTEAGHAEAMDHAAAAFARAASVSAEVAGRVRISASEIIAVEVLPPILAGLQRAHPGLMIDLSPTNRNEDVLRREADIAVRMVRPTQDALVAQRVGDVPLGLHARRDYLAQYGTPDSVAELAGHRIIGVEHDNAILRGMRAQGWPIDVERFGFRSDNDLAQLAAIRAGLGIGFCQIGLAARDRDLVRVLPDTVAVALDTWVVAHEDLRGVARIRATFDHLVAGLRAYISA